MVPAMRNLITTCALLSVLPGVSVPNVSAEQRYDTRLEQMAAEQLARRLGELRGTLAPAEQPVLLTEDDLERHGRMLGTFVTVPLPDRFKTKSIANNDAWDIKGSL
jgi:hypothetical protein